MTIVFFQFFSVTVILMSTDANAPHNKGLFTVSVSDRDSDFLQLLTLANCIHSER